MTKYIRTAPISFEELTAPQQEDAISTLGQHADDTQYIQDPTDKNQVLPLCNFMKTERSKLFDGIYGISYYSAYFIKFDRTGEECVIAYRHN